MNPEELRATAGLPAIAIAGGVAVGTYGYLVPWRGGVWLYKSGHTIVGTLLAIGGALSMLSGATWVIMGTVGAARGVGTGGA